MHLMITRSKSKIFKPKIYLAHKELQRVENLPTDVRNALSSKVWRKAMKEEYRALINNNAWELVKLETTMKVIGNKWVYKVKYNPNGTVSRYKAILIAKGYH